MVTEVVLGDIFISHVEEDAGVAFQIADAFQAAGYSAWCYERDSIPGPSYLIQTATAIEQSSAVILLISPHSLGSHQVTKEVVRAHESVKPIIPVLISVSHVEFSNRQPEWREAIGSATSIAVPPSGVAGILPRILNGVKGLGIEPSSNGAGQTSGTFLDTRRARAASPWKRFAALRTWQKIAVAALAVALVAGGTTTLMASRRGAPAASGVPAVGGSQAPTGGNVVDSATTPLQTPQGPVRISDVRIATQDCPPGDFAGECVTAPNGNRFVIIDLDAWNGGDLIYNTAFASDAHGSYVAFEGKRATVVRSWNLTDSPSGARIVYGVVPPSAEGRDVNLFWPDNPPLRIRLKV